MKLFEIILLEYVGENEWTHHLLVRAKTQSSAEKKAHKYAQSIWYSWDDDKPVKKNEDGAYEFNGGEYVVSITDIREITEEQFCKEALKRAIINIA